MAIKNVTLNPLDMNGVHTLSNGNLTDAFAESSTANIRATDGKTTGKWYWEVKLDSGETSLFIGISNKLYPITSSVISGTTGDALNFRAYYGNIGKKYPEAVAYSTAWAVGNVIGVALDLDNGKLEFYKNGVSMGISHTNLAGMGEVFPFFKGGSATQRAFTVNFGWTPFTYVLPSGYSPYIGLPSNNILILSSGNYQKYTGISWQTVTSITPTEADYVNGNTLTELSTIPDTAWQELTGSVELSYYTDDASITEAQFNIETNLFTLEDEFANLTSISIIEYTDNPSQTESTTTIETDPFSFYDEMGNNFDVLYYTDDPAKTSAELEVNANYSPLDEIATDFDVVTWTNKPVEEVSDVLTPIVKPDVIDSGSLYGVAVDLNKGLGIKSIK